MNAEREELVRRLYEALASLALGVDELRLSLIHEPVGLRQLGALARAARPLLDDACLHLMDAGYAWDGSRFIRQGEEKPAYEPASRCLSGRRSEHTPSCRRGSGRS